MFRQINPHDIYNYIIIYIHYIVADNLYKPMTTTPPMYHIPPIQNGEVLNDGPYDSEMESPPEGYNWLKGSDLHASWNLYFIHK